MENPFESGQRKLIPSTLIYAMRHDQILMLHRNGKPGDFHEGKWNGLGGKLEAGESMLEGASREFAEEAGLQISPHRFDVLGTLQFPLFKPHKNEDWLVFVLVVHLKENETPQKSCQEGTLHFVDQQKILDLNLWDGDRHFLEYVRAQRPFVGCFWYEQGSVSRWWVKPLGVNP